MNFEIFLLIFIINKSIYAQVCEICENLVREFNVGLQKSEKSNFGGGNTAWEEKKLGNYATSETRLVHIMENLCPTTIANREKCQYLREEVEDKIEDWWFKYFKKDPSSLAGLFQFLCIDQLKVCCPENQYGLSCDTCLYYNESSGITCSNHGKCDGNGTRTGNGGCICFEGYSGESCNECSSNYYSNDSRELCYPCHESCLSCKGPDSFDCNSCSNGWQSDSSNGTVINCIDIDECKTDVCTESKYCVNSPGSYKCLGCDPSCASCTGAGSDNCIRCNNGYQKINNNCQDINECSADSELCREPGQKCTNIPGSYSCDCLDNYTKQSDGSCILNVHKKKSEPTDNLPPKQPKNNKNRKKAKKIWTRKFEREFFKLICCILLLAFVSYFFGNYSVIVIIAAIASGYYIYYKSIKLDLIFSKSVIP